MEESAVAHAYQAYGAAVYARCRRILRDGDGARDVTQEVFLRCFNHRATLRPGRELLAWLYRVATNLCLNALRDSDRRRRADLLDPVKAVSPEGPTRRLLRDLLAGNQILIWDTGGSLVRRILVPPPIWGSGSDSPTTSRSLPTGGSSRSRATRPGSIRCPTELWWRSGTCAPTYSDLTPAVGLSSEPHSICPR